MRSIETPRSRAVEVRDQNLHGYESNINWIYGERGDVWLCLKVELLGFRTKTCMVLNLGLIKFTRGVT